jgi:hypothetical protein
MTENKYNVLHLHNETYLHVYLVSRLFSLMNNIKTPS